MPFKLSDLKSATVKVQLLHDGNLNKYDAIIRNAADVEKFMGEELRKLDREYFLVIYLNSRHKVIDLEVTAIGTLAGMVVSPREIFKTAILTNAYEIVLVHNHPSGDPTPSTDDKLITNKMVSVGKLHQIPVRDHVIIGEGYFSFFEAEEIIQS
jgi:DNA repair protein RadC